MKVAATVCCVLGCIVLLLGEAALLFDLFAFEAGPLFELLGWGGLASLAALNLGILTLLGRCMGSLVGRQLFRGRAAWVMLGTSGGILLLLLQYMFLEIPWSVRLATLVQPAESMTLQVAEPADFQRFSLTRRAIDRDARDVVRVMYERIRLNSPQVYERSPLGATIDRYARRYDVAPEFLFFRAYINSFYGEALSGPVPLFRTMTSETIRDVVQIHLPGWFVESRLRQWLISANVLERMVGATLGFKLRYAIHKATLDVSTQPYDVSTFSDVFMVMQLYPEEFDDVLGADPSDGLRLGVGEAFRKLRESAVQNPYEDSYVQPKLDGEYYKSHRAALKQFARGAYYLTVFDFTFATRVQALLSKYQTAVYAAELGEDRWQRLPQWQRLVMLAMVRDLYTPNVGRLAYNVYALPELNSSPVGYVARQAVAADASALGPLITSAWTPPHPEYLWSGAAYQLRVLNDVWATVNPRSIPGVALERSYEQARTLLAAHGVH